MKIQSNINADTDSFWTWKPSPFNEKQQNENRFSIAEIFQSSQKAERKVLLGPGAGAGIGCGAGVGFGLVGGLGYGAWPFNQVKLVFGVGLGCGIGVGFGFGQGVGYGVSSDSLESYVSKESSDSKEGIQVYQRY
ncbi:PREDICTED: keratin type II cytoskeletal [Prunus dulcis]|uniref:PREDICTED: keratin type II cytoskeletal n=1 Tax=Prunus dulcis TaxID=3755 RepID=A0A5E4G227_PRUDU|nr:protein TRIGALACTOSYLDIACYLGLYCEROL 5, chloroplastic [Prunus dulcis]KAI5339383.1 hypothetical protein L3X38_018655 [Prunus dulcis]VVA33668.1 PREDICTED: keratin type II cytoskeletal [Prunus dulcis]